MIDADENPMADLIKDVAPISDAPVAPAHGIAAMALSMALKYHDIGIIKDGAMYQQYKLEGRNMRELHLDMVFETAMKIEVYLLGASDRIAKVVFDAITCPDDEEAAEGSNGEPASPLNQENGRA